MSGKKKIGTRVDEDVWERFRQFVKDRHGGTRGLLSWELEKALEERMASERGPDRMQRIEDELARLNTMLAESEADGAGVDTPTPAATGHTHTQTVDGDHDPDDPPHAKSSTQEKRDWLTAEVRRRSTDQTFSEPAIRKIIDDTWGFDDRTADPMVDAVIERLDAGFDADGRLVWD